jgi:hypothetical protein
MEWQTIVGFVLALLWFVVKNYERKPRVMPPVSPENQKKHPQHQAVPARRKVPDTIKKTYSDKSKPNPLSNRPVPHTAVNADSPVYQAAFKPAFSSDMEKGGKTAETEQMEIHDPDGYEFAERIRLQLKSRQTAREAFIYSEIFKRKYE